MGAVLLENLTKVYANGTRALAGVNLSIGENEFLAVLGPSGSGKTTLLRLIAGLERPTEGAIHIGGRRVERLRPKDRDVAMVFQHLALYPHLTVAQNLAFGLKLRGLAKQEIEQRVAAALEMLGLAPVANSKPHTLSGGQRQRVALGRALVRRPQCYLLDEPLSSLDAPLRLELRRELSRLRHAWQAPAIYVTHDQDEALALGDRVAVLRDGVLEQCASPREIYAAPANRFVASFVGSPPMNFLYGRLTPSPGGGLQFSSDGATLAPIGAPPTPSNTPACALGIRPHDLSDEPLGRFEGECNTLAVQVLRCETAGDRIDLHCSLATGTDIVARLPARHGFDPAGVTRLYADLRQAHLFEVDGAGRRLN